MSQRKASARRGRPLSPAEREWIAGHVGKLSVRQMAEQLQRPKSTVDRAARAIRAERGIPDLASFLRGATMAADERNVARVASEYRQTLVEIERLEGGGGDGDGGDGGIADLIRSLRP